MSHSYMSESRDRKEGAYTKSIHNLRLTGHDFECWDYIVTMAAPDVLSFVWHWIFNPYLPPSGPPRSSTHGKIHICLDQLGGIQYFFHKKVKIEQNNVNLSSVLFLMGLWSCCKGVWLQIAGMKLFRFLPAFRFFFLSKQFFFEYQNF